MELSAGGVEGALLIFGGAVGDQRAAFTIESCKHDVIHRPVSQPRGVMAGGGLRHALHTSRVWATDRGQGSRPPALHPRAPVRLVTWRANWQSTWQSTWRWFGTLLACG